MRIYTTMISISGDPALENGLHLADTIEYQGGLWLVPEWSEAPSEGWKKPKRIIRIDKFRHEPMPGPYPADYLLHETVPKAVLDGNAASALVIGFVVIEAPDISFEIPRGIH